MTRVNDVGLRSGEKDDFPKKHGEDRHGTETVMMASRWHLIDEHEIIWLIADHQKQRRLCADLERIADNLPDLPSVDAVRHIEARLAGFADLLSIAQPSQQWAIGEC